MTGGLTFPEIDPVLFEIGPFAIRWYALAYIGGLILAWRYCRWLTTLPPNRMKPIDFDDFLVWATLGVVLGGRLGYVIFYKPGYYLSNPLEVLVIWEGGMSFHGGLLGVLLAIGLFARSRGVHYFTLADMVGAATPIGLCLGRIANFINSELYGRAADPAGVPWAMVFPTDPDQVPRHPSQVYEAILEGLVLFLILFVLIRLGALKRTGAISGCFMMGYGAARFVVEYFREPDAHLGFIFSGISMGQILSLPMVFVGIGILFWSLRQPTADRASTDRA